MVLYLPNTKLPKAMTLWSFSSFETICCILHGSWNQTIPRSHWLTVIVVACWHQSAQRRAIILTSILVISNGPHITMFIQHNCMISRTACNLHQFNVDVPSVTASFAIGWKHYMNTHTPTLLIPKNTLWWPSNGTIPLLPWCKQRCSSPLTMNTNWIVHGMFQGEGW